VSVLPLLLLCCVRFAFAAAVLLLCCALLLLCCALLLLCCAVLCCCCAVLCFAAVLCFVRFAFAAAVLCCAMLCCAVLRPFCLCAYAIKKRVKGFKRKRKKRDERWKNC